MGEFSVKPYNEEVIWKCEVEWLYRLMPADILLKLKDIIEFAVSEREYDRCSISCGGMRYLIMLIEDELRIREMERTGVSYKDAKEKLIKERQVGDDRSDGTDSRSDSEPDMEEGRTEVIRLGEVGESL